MRLLKGFVIALCGLFIVITLFSLLMPSKVMTSRSVTIQSTPQRIMQEIIDLNSWKNWHPVFKNQKDIVVAGPLTGKGAFAEWTSNNKKNHLEITDVTDRSVRFTLTRPGENDMLNKMELINFKDNSNIQVEWSALTHLKWYPWEKFSGIFVDKITGPGYQAALDELKAFLEK